MAHNMQLNKIMHVPNLREDTVISLSAHDLFNEYQINKKLSNENYLNKMVEVYGKVSLIEIGTSRSNISFKLISEFLTITIDKDIEIRKSKRKRK